LPEYKFDSTIGGNDVDTIFTEPFSAGDFIGISVAGFDDLGA
jgi:hypothetical protein